MQKGDKSMDIFAPACKSEFTECLSLNIPMKIQNNSQAYICLCINEILHKIGVMSEDNYSVIYAMISDSDIFTEF